MGITANTEKRTKTQGPNINSNRQWESQQTQRNEPKNKDPTLTPTDNGNHSKHRETNQKTRTQHKPQQTMGITANTEKRTKTQGPNINSNRQWESQQTQRNEPKNKDPT